MAPPIIVYAEDNMVTRKANAGPLAKAGYDVRECADGYEALNTIHHLNEAGTPAALLLTDNEMPRMSGEDLIWEIRLSERNAIAPEFPIVMLSSNPLVSGRLDPMDAHVHFVPKSAGSEKLLETMSSALVNAGKTPPNPGNPEHAAAGSFARR